MQDFKCGHTQGVLACGWLEWIHTEKEITRNWNGTAEELELELEAAMDSIVWKQILRKENAGVYND